MGTILACGWQQARCVVSLADVLECLFARCSAMRMHGVRGTERFSLTRSYPALCARVRPCAGRGAPLCSCPLHAPICVCSWAPCRALQGTAAWCVTCVGMPPATRVPP